MNIENQPVEQPAPAVPEPAPTEELAAVTQPQEPAPVEEPPEEPKANGFERKVKKLTEKAREAEYLAQYWYNEAQKHQQPAKPAEKAPEEPKFSDYNDIDAFGRAMGKYQADLAVRAALAQREVEQSSNGVLTKYQERLDAFKAQTPDFDEAFEDLDVPLPEDLMRGILEAETGPAIAYHLAKHPKEVDKLLKLSPHRRLLELGKLEVKLTPKDEPEPPKKVSSAPPVIKTPNGSATATKAEDQMTDLEWIAWRNKNDRTLRRGR